MDIAELTGLFAAAHKRCEYVGTPELGVVAGLDLEGRLYLCRRGEVLSRVNPAAIAGHSDRHGYGNPGGDGLWAAPEGTCFGYHYATGSWEVPTGLVQARFEVEERAENRLTVAAEVPLINSEQLGLPCIFRRAITIAAAGTVAVDETIEYRGRRELHAGEFMLAPWSLSQFDRRDGDFCTVAARELRDLYGDSRESREFDGALGQWRCFPSDKMRYQVAAGADCDYIELTSPSRGLRIRREVTALDSGGGCMDIADAPPEVYPDGRGVKYSFYSDPAGFLELEGVGPGWTTLANNSTMTVRIVTVITETNATFNI